MWECMISEARKGRLSVQARKHSSEESTHAAAPEKSALVFQGAGVRRDKTNQLEKIRASAQGRQASNKGAQESSNSEDGQKFSDCYQRASLDLASLASRLAQHNGLRQFSVTFSSRAPPLELRMLLPELEASIEHLLESLHDMIGQLAQMQFPFHSRMGELQRTVGAYLDSAYTDVKNTFNEQRVHLRELRVVAPLTSPMTMPVPTRKFSSISSPPASHILPEQCESSSTVSTRSSPNMPELPCDELFDDDGEVDLGNAVPFAAVMSNGF
mmetsp:Transcript_11695/g.22253  ORF Transcript_11695/g.22253 Transcript_11695/m.22253 type:complete len:270 (+) Transcript_11695:88-897(+)